MSLCNLPLLASHCYLATFAERVARSNSEQSIAGRGLPYQILMLLLGKD